MPRTPLLRLFESLARQHEVAEARGLAPGELRAANKLSRRQFLAGVAAGASALAVDAALSGPALAQMGKNDNKGKKAAPSIAIIGGGMAGLTCALRLADAGLASTIYEAKGRVGGRVFSDNSGKFWQQGQVSEWGGELIDSGHKMIQKLAKRFKLPLDNVLNAQVAGSADTYFFDGEYYSDADQDFATIRKALKAELKSAGYPTTWQSFTPAGLALDHTSIYEWIDTRIPGGHASNFGKLLDVAYAIEFGADTTDQSALNLLYLLGYQPKGNSEFAVFGESDEAYHIRGGNDLLPKAIRAALGPDAIAFGWRMVGLAKTSSGYSLEFATPQGAATVNADAVVLTLPFSVLRTLDTSQAGFDALKHSAINELGASQNAKLMVQFGARTWETPGPYGLSSGGTYSDLGYQASWDVTRAQAGAAGILVGYSGGSVTEELYEGQAKLYTKSTKNPITAQVASTLVEQLDEVLPGLQSQYLGLAELSLPAKDPDFQLAYSYYRVGQYTQFGGYEGVRQDNVFFAGEHCSMDFQGYIEGAAVEGDRAAGEIIKDI